MIEFLCLNRWHMEELRKFTSKVARLERRVRCTHLTIVSDGETKVTKSLDGSTKHKQTGEYVTPKFKQDNPHLCFYAPVECHIDISIEDLMKCVNGEKTMVDKVK